MNVQVIEIPPSRVDYRSDKWELDVLLDGPTYDLLLERTQQEGDVFKVR